MIPGHIGKINQEEDWNGLEQVQEGVVCIGQKILKTRDKESSACLIIRGPNMVVEGEGQ